MEKLIKIMSLCKCSISLVINNHRDTHSSVSECIEDLMSLGLTTEDLPDDIVSEMIRLDTIIDLQFYPNNSVGFFVLFHYDLDLILDRALIILNS